MIQKRNYLPEGQKGRKGAEVERENEGQRFRYLTDLQEFSNVVENQSIRHLGNSEISLLDKIGREERISDSTLFDENREKIFDTKVVEDIRFSFNNLERKEQEQKASHSSLTERYRQEYARATADIGQGNENDRAKQKETVTYDIEKIKSKYLGNQQKEERKFFKKAEADPKYESRQFHDLDSFSKQNFSKKLQESQNLISSKNVDKIFQGVLLEKPKNEAQRYDILPISKQASQSSHKDQIDHEAELKTIKSLEKITANSHVESHPIDQRCLEALFDGLDRNKTGKVDKQNCHIENMREEFQLIFGIVLYRVKYNMEGFNRKEFIGLCYECLRLLNKETVSKLTILLQQNWEAYRQASRQKQQKESFLKQLAQKEQAQLQQLQNQRILREKEERERQAKDKAERQKIVRERQERQRALKDIQVKQARGKQQWLLILKERQERQRQLKQYEQKYKIMQAQQDQRLQKSQQRSQVRCQNCKSLTKNGLSESPPKDKVLLTSRQINQPSQYALSRHRRGQRDTKEAKYQSIIKKDDELKASQKIEINILKEKENHTYKYSTNSNISSHVHETLKQSKNESGRKERRYTDSKKEKGKAENTQKAQASKKKRNISQQILKEHKRNLQQLHKLNDKVDDYISKVPEIEQLDHIVPIQTNQLRYYESSYRPSQQKI